MNEFMELKSTENQTVFVRPEAVGAFEIVPASQRVEGHVKLYVQGFRFLVQIEKEELLNKLKRQSK